VAERAQDIDMERAERAMERAKERISKISVQSEVDFERARVALMKSLIRLQVASKARTRV
jgi:F-type H+-transporting ATPase subunit epsilon